MSKGLMLCVVLLSTVNWALAQEDVTLPFDFKLTTDTSSTPTLSMPFDAGGYADWWRWGNSPRHQDTSFHEMLSGEWAAAIYYDGIDTSHSDPNDPNSVMQAMWLTDAFSWPTWWTNSTFSKAGDNDCWFDAWNDPNNDPKDGVNTAQSTIVNDDGRVKIVIDYEVVDLGETVDDGEAGSPLAFWIPDPTDPYNPDAGEHVFVRSERYVLLQTYTITNIDPNDESVEGIEFYQMLHGHPFEIEALVSSTYDDADYWIDPLENYAPYNPVHCTIDSDTVGSFCFDIAQWNDEIAGAEGHIDWIGFSSRTEPNVLENGFYSINEDGTIYHNVYQKPPRPGTHWNIEERNLNGELYEHGEVAGAMGWYLGSLGPDESVSHTVAIMFGTGPIKTMADVYPPLRLEIEDDAGVCVSPCPSEKTFTIDYSYLWNIPGWEALTYSPADVKELQLTCYLPPEADFVSADPNEGYYDSDLHAYVWYIGDLTGGEDDSVDISVHINSSVIPGGEIVSSVVAEYTVSGFEYSQETEHTTAVCECDCGSVVYVDQDATTGADDGSSWSDAYLKLQDALAAADVCDQIWVAQGIYTPADTFSESATFALVNGVQVYGGFDGTETYVYDRNWADNQTVLTGLFDPNEVDFVVTADADVRWAILDGFTIQRGGFAGVYCQRGSVQIEHNYITDNGIGILCDETQSPIIRNNWIYANTIGMSFTDLQDTAIVRNNTVVDNDPTGVYCDSDIEPSIKNCIFWGHADANDLVGCYATYSCIEYPTDFYEDPNETIYLGIGQGNIDHDPSFETGDYHLDFTSPCIDAGDPNETYYHQRDIDKQFRVLYGRVDMGADEYYDCDYVSDADFNSDGIVNFPDYGKFAQYWLEPVSDPNWNDTYDLAGDGEAIDAADLTLFADEWLWMDCATMTSFPMEEQRGIDETYEMMMMSSGFSAYGLQAAQAEPTLKEQIDHAQYIIDFLERLWKKDKELRKKIDEKDWDAFIDKLYEWFYSLEDLALGAKE